MSALYLFLPVADNNELNLDSLLLNWVYEDKNNRLVLAQGSLRDAVGMALQHHITVVLSGEDVLHLKADVPGKNIHRVQQAIPFVLEDNVIDDVADLHFSIGKTKKSSSTHYDVSVVNKLYFESIILQLENAGIYADVMTADYLLLNDQTLFFDSVRLLINSSSIKFSSAVEHATNLTSAFSGAFKLISCETLSSDNNKLNKAIENITVDKSVCAGSPYLCLIKNASENSTMNFLQGQYKKKKDWSNTSKAWLPVAAVFLVWLLVQGGSFVFNYKDISNKNEILNSEITKIYKLSFPDSRRIIDAKAQMQQKLNELRKRHGQSGRSFTTMLTTSASVFSSSNGLNIKSLRYYDGRIDLEVEIASLQALDRLKQKLQSENGYQVEIQNASSEKDNVTARLQIIGASL